MRSRISCVETTSEEIVAACLVRIERLNSTLSAFITVDADRAVRAARLADRARRRRRGRSPLPASLLAPGRIIVKDGAVSVAPGYGRFVPRRVRRRATSTA